MSEVANPKVRNWLKPIIELFEWYSFRLFMAFFGLIVIVPLIQKLFDLPVGESGLAGKYRTGHYGIAYYYNGDGRRDAQLSACDA